MHNCQEHFLCMSGVFPDVLGNFLLMIFTIEVDMLFRCRITNSCTPVPVYKLFFCSHCDAECLLDAWDVNNFSLLITGISSKQEDTVPGLGMFRCIKFFVFSSSCTCSCLVFFYMGCQGPLGFTNVLFPPATMSVERKVMLFSSLSAFMAACS